MVSAPTAKSGNESVGSPSNQRASEPPTTAPVPVTALDRLETYPWAVKVWAGTNYDVYRIVPEQARTPAVPSTVPAGAVPDAAAPDAAVPDAATGAAR